MLIAFAIFKNSYQKPEESIHLKNKTQVVIHGTTHTYTFPEGMIAWGSSSSSSSSSNNSKNNSDSSSGGSSSGSS